MGLQILVPRAFNSRLECQHKNTLKTHLLTQLIRGEGLSEAHFRVPKEFRRTVGLVCLCDLEILYGSLYCVILLGAHSEAVCTQRIRYLARFKFMDSGSDITYRAVEPLVSVAACVKLTETVSAKNSVNIVVGKAGSVGTHCGFIEQNGVFHAACM